jgi:hypothetical protein
MSRFASTAGTLAQIRSEYPSYHSIEQGGTTQLLDLLWFGGAESLTQRYELEDDERSFRPGLPPSTRSWALHQASRRIDPDDPAEQAAPPQPFPGLTVHEITTRLRNVAGLLALRTTRLVLAWTDPDAPPGLDNAGQMLVAYYAGPEYAPDPADDSPPIEPPADGVLRFQVSAATGTWQGATNLLVLPDPDHPAFTRVFVARTLNEEAAAVGTPGLQRLREL